MLLKLDFDFQHLWNSQGHSRHFCGEIVTEVYWWQHKLKEPLLGRGPCLASYLHLTTAIISSSFSPVSPEQWCGWGPSCCWELLSDVSEATLSTYTLRWRSNPCPQCRESRCLTCSRQTCQPSFCRQRPPCLSASTVLSPLFTTKVSSVWLYWVSKEQKDGWRQARDKWREIQRQ